MEPALNGNRDRLLFTAGCVTSAVLFGLSYALHLALTSRSMHRDRRYRKPYPRTTSPLMLSPRKRSDSGFGLRPRFDRNVITPIIEGISDKIDIDAEPLIVGVAGGSGSGKTTFAQALYHGLGQNNVTFITHDSYYKDLTHLPMEERAKNNFDHPFALATHLLVQHLRQLKRGKAVEIPTYDYATHSRTDKTVVAEPRRVILLEGILIFTNLDLIKELDIKVFVDTEADVRLIRRIHRDVRERGRTLDGIIQQYLKTVRPMHLEFVEPSKVRADVIIPSGVNRVALDMFLSRLQSEIDRPAARGMRLGENLPESRTALPELAVFETGI